jgi:hypothetical protein
LLLTDTLHEDGQVVMIVKLVNFNFPGNFVGLTVLDLNWQVSTIIETTELTRRNSSRPSGSSFRSNHSGPLGSSIQRARITARALSSFCVCHLSVGNAQLSGG